MEALRFDTVLSPVDFSGLSADALREAAMFAGCSGAPLIALYANRFEAPPYFTASRVEELRSEFRASFAEAERSLAAFVSNTLGERGAAVETRVVEGLPADVILDAANSEAGLIVMGTHGRTGYNRWTMGSVAERVLRESRVPLVTVRGPSRVAVRKILCPVTEAEESRQALRLAAKLAGCFGAALTALHIPDGAPAPDLCSWLSAEERAGCGLRQAVRHGDPATQIVVLAGEEDFDLLVLGAPRRKFFEGMVLGTTALRTVRHAPCPVLTVPGERSQQS